MSVASPSHPVGAAPGPSGGGIVTLPWRLIRPMAGQPREHFDAKALEELAASIRAQGQVVPVQVAPLAPGEDPRHRYELIDGERRWRAVQRAGLETIRAEVVDEPDPERRYVRSVVANFARVDNHHVEVAIALDRLRRTMTIKQVAAALGKSEGYVIQHLKLLRLVPAVRAFVHPARPRAERLPFSAAILLADLAPDAQLDALARLRARTRDPATSPLKATRQVLDDLPPERFTVGPQAHARPRTPSDWLRTQGRRLRRLEAELTALDAGRLRQAAGRLTAQERSGWADLLGRIAHRADRLREALRRC